MESGREQEMTIKRYQKRAWSAEFSTHRARFSSVIDLPRLLFGQRAGQERWLPATLQRVPATKAALDRAALPLMTRYDRSDPRPWLVFAPATF